VYLFSNGQVKLANKKFSSIKNDYCISFDNHSDIVEVDDDMEIKKQGFCFVSLKEIQILL